MAKLDPSFAWGAIMRSPMMRLTLPFVGGIAWSMWRTQDLLRLGIILAIVSLVTILLLLLRTERAGRWRRGPVAMIWCFAFGLFWQGIRDPLVHPRHATKDGTGDRLRVMHITAINGITEKVVRADADVVAASLDGVLAPRTGKVMITLMRRSGDPDPIAGDQLFLRSRLEPIMRLPDPGGFDRRSWAASRGMYHECFAGPDAWSVVGHAWRWTDLFEGTRQRVSHWLEESGLPFRERALVKALVLGLRDELDGEQRDAFVRSGTIHVLAVSGTHVGFIYAMLLFMLGWWGGGRRARIGRGLLVLVALWGYAGLTGACPSVLRATIMFSLFTLAGMADRHADALNSLFAAALVLLLWDPHMLIEIGFQLSFLAVMGIILFHSPIERLWVPNNKWVGNLWTLTVMSIAAQTLTTPLSIYLFQAFPVWFLPANLVVVTAAGVAVYGAVALLALHRIPLVGPLLTFLLTLLLTCVDLVTSFFASLPGAYPAIRVGFTDMLLLYALVALMAMWLMWRWRPALRWSLVTIGLLFASWSLRLHQVDERTTFTVYDDRQALQAAMTVGREHIVLGGEDVKEPGSWMNKKVERHQRALGLDAPTVIGPDVLQGGSIARQGATLIGGDRWCAPGMDVRFVRGDEALEGAFPQDHFDVVVLHEVRYLSAEALEHLTATTDRLVLAGGMGWKTREFVRRWCDERAIPCHDIREQGAFVLESTTTKS